MALVGDLFDGIRMARVLSSLMLVLGLGPVLGPLVGGSLAGVVGWRGLFVVLAVLGVLATLAVAAAVPESLSRERRPSAARERVTAGYGRLLRDRRFMSVAAAGGFAMAANFAYVSNSPFVFQDGFGLTPVHYAIGRESHPGGPPDRHGDRHPRGSGAGALLGQGLAVGGATE
jgi:DHA1 family bicyclomycin/chloramphenicol resistance-like MFS transporter